MTVWERFVKRQAKKAMGELALIQCNWIRKEIRRQENDSISKGLAVQE